MAEAPYVASPWGARFHALETNEALGGGAAGGGKSVCLRWDALSQILIEDKRTKLDPSHKYWLPKGHSKGYALFLRRVSTMLGSTIEAAKREFPLVDPGVKWNENEQEFRFTSGFRYRFGHCKDKGDWNRYWGDELTWLGFDELTQFLKKQYQMISQRVRTDDPVLRKMLKIRGMANPLFDLEGMEGLAIDENPNWVRDRFIEPCKEGNVILKTPVKLEDGSEHFWTLCYLPSRLSDNPNKEFAKAYEINLQTRPAHIRKALIKGDWYVVAGAFFAEVWTEDVIIAEHDIPEEWPVFRAMDWGFKKPGCVLWFTLDPDGNLIVIYEYIFQGEDAPKVAENIRAIEESLGFSDAKDKRSPLIGVADTQLWEERGNRAKSMAEEMAAKGVHWLRADKKSRAGNARRVFVRLKDRRGGIPALTFFKRKCPKITSLMSSVQTNPDNPNEPMDGGYDHPVDALFYGTELASRGASFVRRRKAKKKDEFEDEDPDDGEGVRWGYG